MEGASIFTLRLLVQHRGEVLLIVRVIMEEKCFLVTYGSVI